jgi:hypothetical protein
MVASTTTPLDKWPKLAETKHRTDAQGHYTFTVPRQAAETHIVFAITAEHPNYARFHRVG